MCGITGIIDYKNSITKDLLKSMTDTLIHRGPDDSGYELYETHKYSLGFGYRRLAIQDLSLKGHQPMMYENFTIIFNGEVYNFKEIRKELIELNYTFYSDSDTEVMLKAFHHWGAKSVDKFRGMFAFAIHDKQLEKIWVFRDRVGVKPLYYYQKNDLFIYASELKALYQHPMFQKEIDFNALSMYLQFGYIQAPLTIFKNTHKLKAANYLEYDLKSHTFKIKNYWSVVKHYQQKNKDNSYENAQNELEDVLKDSFSLRMISDVPVGTFLSGGIDSSLVTAILQKNTEQPISTFTIGFDDEKFNEAPYAKKIAEHLGTNHTEHYCSMKDAMDIIPKLPEIYDEPFADSSAIPTTLVSQIAKEKVTVALSGDGGDELFAGYSSYELFEGRFNKIKKLSKFNIAKTIIGIIPDPIVKFHNWSTKYYPKYLKLKNTLEHKDIQNMYKVSNSVFTKSEINHALSDKYHFINDPSFENINNIEKMMLSDFNGYLADDILVKVDRASMSISLESREPLLDHKVIEYAVKLPIEFKKNKRILKDILSKYVPKELFERKKTGFGIPINNWLRNDLKYLIDTHMDVSLIKDQNIFDVGYIESLKDLFFRDKIDDRKIWTILMFQMWFSKNMYNNNAI